MHVVVHASLTVRIVLASRAVVRYHAATMNGTTGIATLLHTGAVRAGRPVPPASRRPRPARRGVAGARA